MRQGQQNRRGRGRSNNNNNNNRGGKGHNPLTRTVESNGPDVKIRGNPSHIAEKYITLARDALTSGDVVMAENYLQHAEHYNRIIMSHREQLQSQQDNNRQNNRQYNNNQNNNTESRQTSEGNSAQNDADPVRGSEPQPRLNEQRSREARENGRSKRNNEQRGERQSRGPRTSRGDKADTGNDEPRSDSPPPRRRNTSANGGSKITDGQEAPGFLRNSVAPAAKRRRAPASDAKNGENAEAVSSAGEKDNV